MLAMSAEHLRVIRAEQPTERLVWVDIGGGTGTLLANSYRNSVTFIELSAGWNVEAMDKHFPISQFDAVYVVDLCQPLLDLAQKRFATKGWTNVVCLCQDATTFVLPEWSDGVKPQGSLGFVTLSYSLSMVRPFETHQGWRANDNVPDSIVCNKPPDVSTTSDARVTATLPQISHSS